MMKMKLLSSIFLIILLWRPSHQMTSAESVGIATESEVIVVVAPSVNDSYYAPVFDDVINYHIDFVNSTRQHTDVVMVVKADTLSYVQGYIPDENIIVDTINDIWVRDFSPVFPPNPVKFRYRPQYLSNSDAAWIENSFNKWTSDLGLSFPTSPIKLDGGNFVHNGVDKAIITTRVFADNPTMTQTQIDQTIKTLTGVTQIAYLPEEALDTTGHSDGMVMWVDADTLMVNENDEPFRTQVLTPLQTTFPSVNIIEIPVDYTYAEWQGFVSACGLHVNSLVTDTHIFMATYNQANDDVVQGMIAAQTDKVIVPIDASSVCFMGGAVRCLTWYAKGETADAILQAAQSSMAAPADVDVTHDGNDVLLSWGGVANAEQYEIWRSAAPYFVAHGAGVENIGIVTTPAFTDGNVLGNAGTHHFYTVVAIDDQGRRSVESNRVGEFEFTIQ
jgi:agmatine/peptidylarginine deiminase